MLKAQQNQVAQSANNDLVTIRSNEINYFVQFFTNFGTQCALIAGFQLSSISQVPTSSTTNGMNFVYLYWISTSISICLSLHVLLCSVYLTVFGQGLALRGPVGSMVRAVNGMVVEQEHILYCFSFNIFFLAVSTIATYFVVMSLEGAYICTAVTICAMLLWHHYCLRIYNRFKWTETSVAWRPSLKDENIFVDEHGQDLRIGGAPGGKGKKKGKGKKGWFGAKGAPGKGVSEEVSENPMVKDNDISFVPEQPKEDDDDEIRNGAGYGLSNVTYQGYLTMKSVSSVLRRDIWVRRYMLLCGTQMLYYGSKREYEENPEKPMKARPIDITGYYMYVSGTNPTDKTPTYAVTLSPTELQATGKDNATEKSVAVGGKEIGFKSWEFRFDTQEELTLWTAAFAKVVHVVAGGNAHLHLKGATGKGFKHTHHASTNHDSDDDDA